MSKLLFRLIASHFLFWIGVVAFACVILVAIGGLVENLKVVNKLGASAEHALILTAYSVPTTLVELSAFILLFASVIAYVQLNETQSIPVMRAAGLSVWQFSAPSLLATLGLSLIVILLLDPLASRSRDLSDRLVSALKGHDETLNLLSTGVWVRQTAPDGHFIIHGRSVTDPEIMNLADVTVYVYNQKGTLNERVQAKQAQIIDGAWQITMADQTQRAFSPRNLVDANDIRDRLTDARVIPVWRLPDHIRSGRAAGLDMTLHEIRFHRLLATPIFLVLMVLIAILFSVPRGRAVSLTGSIGLALLFGFIANVTSQVVAKVAQLAYLPSGVAAWLPSAILVLLTVSLLVDREES